MNLLTSLIALALMSGCTRKDADLAFATHAFEQRYPSYITRSIKTVKRDDKVMEVALNFEAPDNLKPRGLAALVFHKDSDGSWLLQEEKIHMWPR
jgi:hypothetical protein